MYSNSSLGDSYDNKLFQKFNVIRNKQDSIHQLSEQQYRRNIYVNLSNRNVIPNHSPSIVKNPYNLVYDLEEQYRNKKLTIDERAMYEWCQKIFSNFCLKNQNLDLINSVLKSESFYNNFTNQKYKLFQYNKITIQQVMKLKIHHVVLENYEKKLDQQIFKANTKFKEQLKDNMKEIIEEQLQFQKKKYENYPQLIEQDINDTLKILPQITSNLIKEIQSLNKEIDNFEWKQYNRNLLGENLAELESKLETQKFKSQVFTSQYFMSILQLINLKSYEFLIQLMKIILIALVVKMFILKMPLNYDEKLWCNSCQAICREMIRIIGESKSEMYIDDALSNLCTPQRFGVYEYPPPQMFKGCNDFVKEHYQDIEDAFMSRESNQTVETDLCMKRTKACLDEELQLIMMKQFLIFILIRYQNVLQNES